MLDSSLKVSAAAIQTGQPVAAGGCMNQLSDTFPSAPEPKTRTGLYGPACGRLRDRGYAVHRSQQLGHTAGHQGRGAARGTGRASLGREDFTTAKTHFLAAAELATARQWSPG